MEQVTRQVIDARAYPITITTIPASRSVLAPYRPAPILTPAPLPAPRRRAVFPAVVGGLAFGAAVFGFTLGWLGIGLSSLVSLATVVGAFVAIYVLMALFGGRGSGPHCPGPFHR